MNDKLYKAYILSFIKRDLSKTKYPSKYLKTMAGFYPDLSSDILALKR